MRIKLDNLVTKQINKIADNMEIKLFDKLEGDEFPIGCRIGWLHKEDVVFHEKDFGVEDYKNYAPYEGIVVPIEDVETHRPLDSYDLVHKSMVVMTDYPVEKEYCEATWLTVAELLSDETIVWIGRVD